MDTAPSTPTTRLARRRGLRLDPALLALIAVGLSPAIFALAAWDPAQSASPLRFDLRRFSAPIVAIELAVILLAMARGLSFADRFRMLSAAARPLLGVLAIVATVTALWVAPLRADAVARTAIALLHLLFGFAATHLIASLPHERRRLIWPAVATGVLLYALLVPAFLASRPSTFDWRYFGLGVINIRHVGYYAAAGAAVSLALAASSETIRRWAFPTLAAAACLALAFWSGTRGALAAVAAAVAIGSALLPVMRTPRAAAAVVAAFAIGAAFALFLPAGDSHFGVSRITSSLATGDAEALSSGRLALWIDTARHVADRPWFGHGDGQFRALVAAGGDQFNHPHNALLQFLLQWGLVGSACIAALAAMMIRRALVQRRCDARAAPAFMLLFAMLAYAMVDGTLYYPYPIMMVALAFAFLLAPDATEPATTKGRPPR